MIITIKNHLIKSTNNQKKTILNRYIEFSIYKEMSKTQKSKQQTFDNVKKLKIKFAKLKRKIANEFDDLNHLHVKNKRQWKRRIEKLKKLIFDIRHNHNKRHSKRHSKRKSNRRYIDKNVKNHRNNEKHRCHRNKSSFRNEKRKRNKSSFRNEKRKRNHREKFSIFSNLTISELSYIFFISRSKIMFSLFDVQSVYQNSFSNSIKLKKNSKKQIQNSIEWKIQKNRCFEFERELDAYQMTNEILIDENFNFRQIQIKKNIEIWWIQQNIKFDIDDELVIDAKIFEKIWLKRELKFKQNVENSSLFDSMRNECIHFIFCSCDFRCERKSKQR